MHLLGNVLSTTKWTISYTLFVATVT